MSRFNPPKIGVPAVTSKPLAGTAIDKENALALMRWHPVQWQAMVRSGVFEITIRVLLQRQPPVRRGHVRLCLLILSTPDLKDDHWHVAFVPEADIGGRQQANPVVLPRAAIYVNINFVPAGPLAVGSHLHDQCRRGAYL